MTEQVLNVEIIEKKATVGRLMADLDEIRQMDFDVTMDVADNFITGDISLGEEDATIPSVVELQRAVTYCFPVRLRPAATRF